MRARIYVDVCQYPLGFARTNITNNHEPNTKQVFTQHVVYIFEEKTALTRTANTNDVKLFQRVSNCRVSSRRNMMEHRLNSISLIRVSGLIRWPSEYAQTAKTN